MASFLPSSSLLLLLLLLFLFANALPSSGDGLVSKKMSVEGVQDPGEKPEIVALAEFGLDSVNAYREKRWQKLQKREGRTAPPLPPLKFVSLKKAQMVFTDPGNPSSVEFVIGSDQGAVDVTLDVESSELTLRTWLLHPSNSK